ncbi:hypothetical protein DL96DRAFT_1593255 [Flagelloscypha sp. PMI_526]|nr:hypothetical protein DL96DRAFT_1593255 [Flagelloscypha sp. PMI_526]
MSTIRQASVDAREPSNRRNYLPNSGGGQYSVERTTSGRTTSSSGNRQNYRQNSNTSTSIRYEGGHSQRHTDWGPRDVEDRYAYDERYPRGEGRAVWPPPDRPPATPAAWTNPASVDYSGRAPAVWPPPDNYRAYSAYPEAQPYSAPSRFVDVPAHEEYDPWNPASGSSSHRYDDHRQQQDTGWSRDQRRDSHSSSQKRKPNDSGSWASSQQRHSRHDREQSVRESRQVASWPENPPYTQSAPQQDLNRSWEPNPAWDDRYQPNGQYQRPSLNSDRQQHNRTSQNGHNPVNYNHKNQKSGQKKSNQHKSWRTAEEDDDLNNWQRRDGVELRVHPRRASRSPSPSGSYYSRQSARGRSHSPVDSPQAKRRRQDTSEPRQPRRPSPTYDPMPSPEDVIAKRSEWRGPNSNLHEQKQTSRKRRRSVSSVSTVSSERSRSPISKQKHRLPTATPISAVTKNLAKEKQSRTQNGKTKANGSHKRAASPTFRPATERKQVSPPPELQTPAPEQPPPSSVKSKGKKKNKSQQHNQQQQFSQSASQQQPLSQDTPISSFAIPAEIQALQRNMNVQTPLSTTPSPVVDPPPVMSPAPREDSSGSGIPIPIPNWTSQSAHDPSPTVTVPPWQNPAPILVDEPVPVQTTIPSPALTPSAPTPLSASALTPAHASVVPMGPPSIVPTPRLRREAISASISKGFKKSAGFKPIGTVASSLKRFFPGEDDESMEEDPPATTLTPVAQLSSSLPVHPLLTDRSQQQQESPPAQTPTSGESPMDVETPESSPQSHKIDSSVELEASPTSAVPGRGQSHRKGRSSLSKEVFPDKADTIASTSADLVQTEQLNDTTPAGKTQRRSLAKDLKPPELYTIVNQVGEGTFGKVYKAQNTLTKVFCALKRIRMENERDGFPVTAMREIKLLQSLKHQNVIRLHEMMTQFVFTDGHLKSFCHQMLSGLAYLHHKGVIHRDIKGSNILVNNRGQLKLADFGLARFYQKRRRSDYTNRVITLWYRPPELLLGATVYGAEVDMWSAGCIMLELFTKKPVFQGNDEIHQLDVIYKVLGTPTVERWPALLDLPWYELVKPTTTVVNHFRDLFKRWMSPAGINLAEKLLAFDPDQRVTAMQALDDPYFTEEEPAADIPVNLSSLEGEWHELDTKREKAKQKKRESTSASASASAANSTQHKS